MRTFAITLTIIGLFAVAAPSIALAGSTPKCAANSIVGTYGVQTTGFSDFVPGPVPSRIGDFVPIASVGLITFTSNGTTGGNETANVGGFVFPFSSTGAYVINADCTGTLTRSLSIGGAAEVLHLVIVQGGAKILVMSTQPGGRLFTGAMERLADRDD